MKRKPKANKFEKIVEELDSKVPFRTCHVCEREGRDLVWACLNKYRCRECAPGTPNWLDWYESQPAKSAERTELRDRIYSNGRKA